MYHHLFIRFTVVVINKIKNLSDQKNNNNTNFNYNNICIIKPVSLKLLML